MSQQQSVRVRVKVNNSVKSVSHRVSAETGFAFLDFLNFLKFSINVFTSNRVGNQARNWVEKRLSLDEKAKKVKEVKELKGLKSWLRDEELLPL